MPEPIEKLLAQLSSNLALPKKLLIKSQFKYFLVNPQISRFVSEDFFHAGAYLGRIKDRKFEPSFHLLKMIAEKKANKVFVKPKSEWLFICGRDLFKRGITHTEGSDERGAYTLVMNENNECIGYGEIKIDPAKAKADNIVVKNITDIGDLLRREKTRNQRPAQGLSNGKRNHS